ncbi:MAG: hypothetical protein PUG15_01765 [Bacteroidales bacterium]|nr:hypothetical protein [Bacteroidales bacterium]
MNSFSRNLRNEIKKAKKNASVPKAFSEAYLDATFMTITLENYWDFIS